MTAGIDRNAAAALTSGATMSDVLHDARAPVIKVRPDREMATTQRLPYFVGISEVRRVERLRGGRFAFDNLEALQRERATLGVARLLNPLLRQPPRPSR